MIINLGGAYMIKEVRLMRRGKDGRLHYIEKSKLDKIFKVTEAVLVGLQILVAGGMFIYVYMYMS